MKKTLLSLSAFGLLLGGIVVGQSIQSFPDVSPNDWFHTYVEEIKDWGVVSGNDDGTFAPARNINRAEFSKMLTLYDKRVDQKIDTLETSAKTGEEAMKTIFIPNQVMHFQRYDVEPSKCPQGWNEAVSGLLWQESSKKRYGRTCYTDQICQTMELELFGELPPNCPEEWSEADSGLIWRDGWKERYSRVCYKCGE